MKETLLKKDIRGSDLTRMRNLIRKDYTAGTQIGIGYKKKQEDRKEGDVWEERGRTWTIKNGIRQSITKLDKAREAIRIPLACPKCNKAMNTPLDKKMYKIHGFCFDCTIEYEAELKEKGLYKAYEESLIKGNVKQFLQEIAMFIEELSENTEDSGIITEAGDVEDWKGNLNSSKKKNLDTLKEYIDHLNKSFK